MFAHPQNKHKFREIERRREFREEIKNRLKEANLRIPGFVKLTHTGRFQCQICKSEHPEINSFRLHLREKTHRLALDSLKEELEVQKKVNAHIQQLIKAQNSEDSMQEEAIEVLLRDKTDYSLGKRTDDPQLIIEERVIASSEQDHAPAIPSVEAEEPESELTSTIKPEDEEAELARLAGNQEPDPLSCQDTSAAVLNPLEKDPMRNKEQTIENRLKARMEQMKEKLKGKK